MELSNPLGYLPLLIPLLAVLLLTGLIVTYTLRGKLGQAKFFKENWHTLVYQRAETVREALEKIDREAVEGYDHAFFQNNMEPQPEAIAAINRALAESNLEHPEIYTKRLPEFDRQIRDYGKTYRYIVRDYNRLLLQMPTKMFAKLFRYRPLTPEV